MQHSPGYAHAADDAPPFGATIGTYLVSAKFDERLAQLDAGLRVHATSALGLAG